MTGPGAAGELLEIRILGAPVRLWERAQAHTDELIREFTLLAGADARDSVPAQLRDLIADVRARYGTIGQSADEARDAARAAGASTIDLRYDAPATVAQACRELATLLDRCDEYCRAGDNLLTLATSPDQVAFRRWFLGEFIAQAQGAPPTPWAGPLH